MTRLVVNPQERLCSQCITTPMVQLIRTKTWICPVCTSLDYYTPGTEEPEPEDEYQIEVK
ncbi:MAG: hypothetical protein ACRD8W_03445 [Nitrososphaeraceae archaeon]